MIVEETRVFELDDDIAEDIMELNRLGYTSTFACSGHLEEFDKLGIDCYSMGTYISFNNIARIQLSNEFGYNIPNNWIYDDRDKQLVIRRHYTQDEVDLLTKEQLLELTWSELHNWVESLPMVGYFNILGYEIKEFFLGGLKMSRMTKVLKEWFRHLGIAIIMVLATIGIMWLFCFLMETISLIGAIVIDALLFVIVLNILK